MTFSGVVYSRRVKQRVLTFAFDSGLYKENLQLTDVETGSLWSQLEARAIRGPMKGATLTDVPHMQTTWNHWKTLHPQTMVVDMSIGGDRSEMAELRPSDALVLGVCFGSSAKAYPFEELIDSPSPLNDRVGGREILVHYDSDANSAWATDLDGNLLPALTVTQSGWQAFHPTSNVYESKQQSVTSDN